MGWANELGSFNMFSIYHSFSVFSVSIDLTPTGLANWQKVVEATFAKINQCKIDGPKEWFFNELKSIQQLNFDNKSKEDPLSYA